MTTVPAHPSLEFDRKQAKRLLASLKSGDEDALSRLRTFHPRYRDPNQLETASLTLADAQLVIAREYGFPSWPRWKQFVEIVSLEEAERTQAFLRAVCSDDADLATRMLALGDTFTAASVAAAAAAGNHEALSAFVLADPDCVSRPIPPLNCTPLVYACQSRLLVTAPARRAAIVACAQTLLAAGADPNAFFLVDGETDLDHRQSAIYGAAGIANDPVLTKILLDAGADPNDGLEGKAGETLYHAAEFSDTTCLRLLLAADPDKAALDYCLGRALDFNAPDAARCFIEFGADVEYRIPWFDNQTHLMRALKRRADPDLLVAMIEQSTDLNAQDSHGVTTYRYAIRAGLDNIAQRIVEKGATASAVTPVDRVLGACMRGDIRAVEQMLADEPGLPAQLSDQDRELLPYAARRQNRQAVALLVRLGIPIDFGAEMPALHQACFAGDLKGVRQLLAFGPSLSVKNSYGGTALGAAIHGSVTCHDASGGPQALPPESVAPRGYAEIVALLIEQGAELPETAGGSRGVQTVLQQHLGGRQGI